MLWTIHLLVVLHSLSFSCLVYVCGWQCYLFSFLSFVGMQSVLQADWRWRQVLCCGCCGGGSFWEVEVVLSSSCRARCPSPSSLAVPCHLLAGRQQAGNAEVASKAVVCTLQATTICSSRWQGTYTLLTACASPLYIASLPQDPAGCS